MPTPETTSAEAYLPYTQSKLLKPSRGKAWRELKAWIAEPLRQTEALTLPSVSEAYLAWTFSGEAMFEEREGDGPWITHHISAGSFFLTTGGGPYECRWRALGSEPFLTMMTFVELPLLQRALTEQFGANAAHARLLDQSAFRDPQLNWMMERVKDELMARRPGALRVQALAQLIATHLARNYAEVRKTHASANALPEFKVKRVTEWIRTHLAEDFDLELLAQQAGLSKFHFHRLFKEATGTSPAKYQLDARIQEAKRRLRETRQRVIEVALDLGYSSPSHFAQSFRRETGMTPSAYRRQV